MSYTTDIPEFYKNYKAKTDESLYDHTAKLLKEFEKLKKFINKDKEECKDVGNKVKIACIWHDIGKINSQFQKRLETGDRFNSKTEVGHNILSAELLFHSHLANKIGQKIELYELVYAVLAHHNYVDNIKEFVEHREKIKSVLVDEVKNIEGIDKYINIESLSNELKYNLKDKLQHIKQNPSKDLIFIKGITHKCDYAASAGMDIEIKGTSLNKQLKSLDFSWNSMQDFAKENCNENIVCIGSTGLGKTEASLLWLNDTKGFYVLPLKAAINAMYDRIKNYFVGNDDRENEEHYSKNVGLLHGETKEKYLESIELEQNLSTDIDSILEYYNGTKRLSLPLTIATPDQIFKFVFKYPAYEVPLVTYSYSKIIIDEIQAYEPELLAYLIYGIQQILYMGGKVAIMTATFPDFIWNLINLGIDSHGNWDEKIYEYKFKKGEYLNDKIRHKVRAIREPIGAEKIDNILNSTKDYKKGKKVLVVANTVKRAQKIYKDFKEKTQGRIEINLLHNRFTKEDRKQKEKSIIECSKNKNKNERLEIWIATQIVEASLDISFDYLFTELSDMSGFIQRMGRCNRDGINNIDSDSDANIYVFTEIDEKLLRSENNSKGFIYKEFFDVTKDYLLEKFEKVGEVFSENDKNESIKNIYDYERLKNSKYIEDYKKAYKMISDIVPEEVNKRDADYLFRKINNYTVIPTCVYIEKGVDKKIETLTDKKEKLLKIYVGGDKNQISAIKNEISALINEIMEYTVQVSYLDSNLKEEWKSGNQNKSYIDCLWENVWLYSAGYSKETGLITKLDEEARGRYWDEMDKATII